MAYAKAMTKKLHFNECFASARVKSKFNELFFRAATCINDPDKANKRYGIIT